MAEAIIFLLEGCFCTVFSNVNDVVTWDSSDPPYVTFIASRTILPVDYWSEYASYTASDCHGAGAERLLCRFTR